MSNITEIKPERKRDPRDIIKGCKAYGFGDCTSPEWCRRNRGEWCKTDGKWCCWRKI
jgi:hypothetical protein